MQAPELTVMLDDGASVSLSSLYEGAPLAIVFLRHFGCVFCRYQVSQLRKDADLNLVFVCMEPPSEAKAFKEKLRSPHRFICDSDRRLYESFGISRATMSQVFSLRTVRRGMQAMLAGSRQSRPTSDPMQLSGAFCLDKTGKTRWSHYAQDVSDIVSGDRLRTELARISQVES
ncbi:MAG: AhpC/TSA family protein [Armatimonadetes bacterium]|nr:AhpC/TSA family protein [Armatimonadota bacterium]